MIPAQNDTRPDFVNMVSLGEPNSNEINQNDILTAMEFNKQGNKLAVGDRGGRVIIFGKISGADGTPEYDYLTEFQSHIKVFDVLDSKYISEAILGIKWLPQKKFSFFTVCANGARLWSLNQQKEANKV